MQGQVATQVPHMKASVQVVLDSLCTHYLKEPRQVSWHAHHHLGGQMLVEAAFVALPRENGAKVRSLCTGSPNSIILGKVCERAPPGGLACTPPPGRSDARGRCFCGAVTQEYNQGGVSLLPARRTPPRLPGFDMRL